jgi:hypothetical protein
MYEMANKNTYRFVLAFLLMILFIGCTKSDVRSKKLIKKGRWIVTQLDIGTNEVTLIPKWYFPTSPEDKQFATATWTHFNSSTAEFRWRFDYYEGTFTFMIDQSVSQDESTKAYIQCDNLSGSYTILTDKSKLFEFESTETMGYPGVSVFIQIQPN